MGWLKDYLWLNMLYVSQFLYANQVRRIGPLVPDPPGRET
jgi:hypothetical protein